MAYVGAVYTIAPWERTAEDVVDEVRRRQRAKGRPLPQHKQVWAEMTTLAEGEAINGRSVRLGIEAPDAVPIWRAEWMNQPSGPKGRRTADQMIVPWDAH